MLLLTEFWKSCVHAHCVKMDNNLQNDKHFESFAQYTYMYGARWSTQVMLYSLETWSFFPLC